MEAIDLLREQAANADSTLLRVFTPVTPEQASWRLPGSTANTIALTFLHIYVSEDDLLHRFAGGPSLFANDGWGSRLGYDPEAWTLRDPPDKDLMLAYAEAVTAARRDYLATATPEQLEEEVETRQGRRKVIARLSGYLVAHKLQHTGEIAALLGCQGVKGLPF